MMTWEKSRMSALALIRSLHTYPFLRPCVSRTTISREEKSRAVTVSKATSKKIRDHSRKAYFV